MAAKAELIPGGVEEIIQDSPLNPLSLHTIMKVRDTAQVIHTLITVLGSECQQVYLYCL